MTARGFYLRLFDFLLMAMRGLTDRESYLHCCQEMTRRASLQLGVGASNDSNVNGENAFLSTLPPCACIFDVGACSGEFARAALALLSEPSIHCFEPSPTSYAKLRELRGIYAMNFGLSDRSETAELYADRDGSELSSLYRRRLDHFGLSFDASRTVRLRTLDDYCEEHGIGVIDLLKIDAEGHELSVLRGARRMLSTNAIRRILFEFGGTDIDSRVFLQDFFYLLAPFGFSIGRLLPDGRLFPLGAYREIYEQFTYTNYVAVKPNCGRSYS